MYLGINKLIFQLNSYLEASDPHSHLAMQRKKSLEGLHDNGDVAHSGWNEHG